MVLNEQQEEIVSQSYNFLDENLLNEQQVKEIIEDKGASEDGFYPVKYDIREEHLHTATQMIQLQENSIKLEESNVSGNVADYVPKLQPMLRRFIPRLMGWDLCGIQPLKTPSQLIFMLKAQYAGNALNEADKDTSRILVMTQGSTPQPIAVGDQLTSENGAQATVVFVTSDYKKAVINVTTGTFTAGDKLDVGGSYAPGADDITVDEVYLNEASHKQIIPEYTGPYTTANAEELGDDMNQIRVFPQSQQVTAKSRAIKAELTIEFIQDMKALHNLNGEREVLFYLETEIVNDINMEIIDKFKEIATIGASFAVATQNDSQGRWSKEMYSGLWDRILKDSNDLSKRNRRGRGNKLVATSGVISALQSLGLFKTVEINANIKHPQNHSENYVGTLMNDMDVYLDWYAEDEGYTVIYKGPGNWDNGVIYCPYQPIIILNATNPKTLQPIMAIKTRSVVVGNELLDENGAPYSAYCTRRGVDFTNTPLKEG